MKGKKLKLIFKDLQNVHLVKDVGMIPYYMHKNFGYDSEIIYLEKKENLIYKKFVKELKLKPLKRPFYLNTFIYLIKNAKNIDVLMQFHTNPDQIIFSWLYRLLNKKGIVFVRSDFAENIFEIKKFGLFNLLRRWKTILSLKAVDILIVERHDMMNFFRKNYNKYMNKIVYMTTCFDDAQAKINLIPFDKKENLIITIGRLGTRQKATETILNAIELIKEDLNGWKIMLIGSIKKGFEKRIEKFYKKNPDLKNKIIFTGNITERKKLIEIYKKAKIFCFPSRWEGFGLVLPEAGYFGNALVSTKVGGAEDITDREKYGKLCKVDDILGLANSLKYYIKNKKELKKACTGIQKYCRENFVWRKAVNNLQKRILEIKK